MMGQWATHVVVDTRDGYTYYKDADGVLFSRNDAIRFARHRNDGCDAGRKSYAVFTLQSIGAQEAIVHYDYNAPPLRQPWR